MLDRPNVVQLDTRYFDNPPEPSDPIGQAIANADSALLHLVKVIADALDDDPELIDQIAHDKEYEIMREVMNKAAWVATLIETRMIANAAMGAE